MITQGSCIKRFCMTNSFLFCISLRVYSEQNIEKNLPGHGFGLKQILVSVPLSKGKKYNFYKIEIIISVKCQLFEDLSQI